MIQAIVVALAFTGLSGCQKPEGQQFETSKLREACVRIFRQQMGKNGPSITSATGFLIGEKGHVVTNHHVVDDTNKLYTNEKSRRAPQGSTLQECCVLSWNLIWHCLPHLFEEKA